MEPVLVWQRQCPRCYRRLEREPSDDAWLCACGWTDEDVSRGRYAPDVPHNKRG